MPSYNKCCFMGNVTRDPETRVTQGGTSICSFSIAVNRKYKDGNGAEKEEVNYFDFEAWAKTAELIQKYVTKGRPIFVEARAKLDQWEDKNTKEKRSRIKFVVENVQFLGSNREQAAPKAQEQMDEDVPF